MKQKIAMVLAVCMIFSGCTNTDFSDPQYELPTEQEQVSSAVDAAQQNPEQHTVRLAYQAEQSLNPYKTTSSINRELMTLFYDSLVRPDLEGRPELLIASEITPEEGGYAISLRKDALMSDGTNATGADLLYSAELARAAGSVWAPLLSNVAEMMLDEAGIVHFRLFKPDADFPLLLSFPIIKEGSVEREYPPGVSRYLIAGTIGSGLVIRPNPIYYQAQGTAKEMWLINIDGDGALSFGVKAGDVDFAYSDLSAPELFNLTGTNAPVQLNHLVFVGINGTKGVLARPEFRHAISLAVNRDQLVARACVGRADAAVYPIHPSFYRLEEQVLSTAGDLIRAEALLDGLGMNEKNQEGWRLYQNEPVVLSLLVNSENSMRNAVATMVAEQLAEVGIKVNLVSKSFSEYQDELLSYGYDMYIGEVRLTPNMDFSLLLAGGRLGYAVAQSEELSERLNTYRATGEQLPELCEMFTAQSPFLPLLFRQGLVTTSEFFTGTPQATEQDLFYNVAGW